MQDHHEGGCQCGHLRYRTTGEPVKVAACHCRYCQLRTGSAFGVSVYFDASQVDITGETKEYTFQTESGRSFTTHFCPTCGTNVFWIVGLTPDLIGIAGGSFDPPTFWYDLKREVFARSRAPFVNLAVEDSHETFSKYAPTCEDPLARSGKPT